MLWLLYTSFAYTDFSFCHCWNMQIASKKAAPSSYENSVLSKLNARLPQPPEVKKNRNKRRKGPNPLSRKKSTKLCVKDNVYPAGVASRSKVSVSLGFVNKMLSASVLVTGVHWFVFKLVQYAAFQWTLVSNKFIKESVSMSNHCAPTSFLLLVL